MDWFRDWTKNDSLWKSLRKPWELFLKATLKCKKEILALTLLSVLYNRGGKIWLNSGPRKEGTTLLDEMQRNKESSTSAWRQIFLKWFSCTLLRNTCSESFSHSYFNQKSSTKKYSVKVVKTVKCSMVCLYVCVCSAGVMAELVTAWCVKLKQDILICCEGRRRLHWVWVSFVSLSVWNS